MHRLSSRISRLEAVNPLESHRPITEIHRVIVGHDGTVLKTFVRKIPEAA